MERINSPAVAQDPLSLFHHDQKSQIISVEGKNDGSLFFQIQEGGNAFKVGGRKISDEMLKHVE